MCVSRPPERRGSRSAAGEGWVTPDHQLAGLRYSLRPHALQYPANRICPEFDGLDRNTLIGGVNRLGEVQVFRRRHGEATIGLNTEPRKETSIRRADQEQGDGHTVRVALSQDISQSATNTREQCYPLVNIAIPPRNQMPLSSVLRASSESPPACPSFSADQTSQPSATSRTIITENPSIVAMVTRSIFSSVLCDSGISSSTTTKIMAPAAKQRA